MAVAWLAAPGVDVLVSGGIFQLTMSITINDSMDSNETSRDSVLLPTRSRGQVFQSTVQWYGYWITPCLGVVGSLLLWAAFPPIGWWPLAWLAPIPWVLLVRMEYLPGRWPYCTLWLTGILHWLLVIHWIRLPHWSAIFGWLALSLYLSAYIPLFIGLSRLAVHRLSVSTIFAVPMVWTGLELLRGHLLTGFSMALLGHTQVHWTTLVQIADLVGGYGVSFLVMLVASSLSMLISVEKRSRTGWPCVVAGVCLVVSLVYGHVRLDAILTTEVKRNSLRIALVQGAIDVTFDRDQRQETIDHYLKISCSSLDEYPDVDVIMWPESMCSFLVPFVTYDQELTNDREWKFWVKENTRVFHRRMQELIDCHHAVLTMQKSDRPLPVFIVCSESVHVSRRVDRYNTALLIDGSAQIVNRYDKMHPVMFGEYVPLGNQFPQLYRFTPMGGGLTAGKKPAIFEIQGVRLSPSICFESTVPHLIRRQVRQLERRGTPPHALVNLTNDGWFWGSSELDLHLTCGIFRAIENRLPMLIAANTGFSAWIDAGGQVIQRGPRRAKGLVVANVQPRLLTSFYRKVGDLFAGMCLLGCLVVLVGAVLLGRK